jgi:SAM-dependent methyltransferase
MSGSLEGMNTVERFSDRVDLYIRYRPGYPREILETLRRDCGFTPESALADIGCGPGNLALVFLENGNAVFGVEPNAGMREAGRRALDRFPKFRASDGRSEATGLPAASVDFITAGQAFHWFEPEATRAEFRRILKPGGWVVLLWNERGGAASGLLDEYEALQQRYGIDYKKVRERRNNEPAIVEFLAGGELRRALFHHAQSFDFEGLKGRLLSSSYSPPPGHPSHEPMLAELRGMFDRHRQGGFVDFPYETTMWYGQFGRSAFPR